MTSKYTKSARGQECQFRIPGVCNHNNETTVFCHDPFGSGIGTKYPDTEGGYGCSDCHDLIDHRTESDQWPRHDVMLMFYQGSRRTRILMIESGILKL